MGDAMEGAPASDGGMPGRPRRIGTRAVALIAGVIVIVLLLALGARAVISRAMCGQRPVIVNIAASLDIAPAVQQIGSYFNNLNRNVSGHCAEVEVTEQNPQHVAGQVSGQTRAAGQLSVDAWVPDSSLWVDIVRSSALGGAAVRPTGVSLAQSPLVIAVPKQTSHDLISAVRQTSWQALLRDAASGKISLAGINFQMPDPTEDAAGLATVVEARRVFGKSGDPRGQLTSLVHNVQATTPFDNVTALTNFAGQAQPPMDVKPVTITSEQAAESYNRSNPGKQLDVIYPSGQGGAPGAGPDYDLDYPFAITTSDSLKVRAAQQFSQVLRSSLARSDVQKLGFRSPSGEADASNSQYGVRPTAPPRMPAATPGEAQEALQQWKQLNLGSRDLVLNDVSGVTGSPLGSGGETEMSVLQKAAGLGLGLFPDSTEMGAWEYSDRMDGAKPYKVMVPVGPLPQQLGLINRRQQLQQLTKTMAPRPGVAAALYSSILAAFQWMTAHYVPDHVNAVIVLGSGTKSASDDISLSTLLTRLRKAFNPQRPVEIIAVSAGSGSDQSALSQVTAITNGASFVVRQPSDIDKVFFDSVGRRICKPNCG